MYSLTLPPGTYTFKGKAYIPSNSGRIILKVVNEKSSVLDIPANTTFTEFSVSGIVVNQNEVRLQMYSQGDDGAVTYWDDLSLIKS